MSAPRTLAPAPPRRVRPVITRSADSVAHGASAEALGQPAGAVLASIPWDGPDPDPDSSLRKASSTGSDSHAAERHLPGAGDQGAVGLGISAPRKSTSVPFISQTANRWISVLSPDHVGPPISVEISRYHQGPPTAGRAGISGPARKSSVPDISQTSIPG